MSDKIFSPYVSEKFHIPMYDQKHDIPWFSEDISRLIIPWFNPLGSDLAINRVCDSIKEHLDLTLYRMRNAKFFDPKGLEIAMRQQNLATLALCCTENVYYIYEGTKVSHVRFLDLDRPTTVPYSSDESAMSFTLNKIYTKKDEYAMQSKSFLIHPDTLKLLDESDWIHNPMYTTTELKSLLHLIESENTDFSAQVVGRFIEVPFCEDENISMGEYLRKVYEYRKHQLLAKLEGE